MTIWPVAAFHALFWAAVKNGDFILIKDMLSEGWPSFFTSVLKFFDSCFCDIEQKRDFDVPPLAMLEFFESKTEVFPGFQDLVQTLSPFKGGAPVTLAPMVQVEGEDPRIGNADEFLLLDLLRNAILIHAALSEGRSLDHVILVSLNGAWIVFFGMHEGIKESHFICTNSKPSDFKKEKQIGRTLQQFFTNEAVLIKFAEATLTQSFKEQDRWVKKIHSAEAFLPHLKRFEMLLRVCVTIAANSPESFQELLREKFKGLLVKLITAFKEVEAWLTAEEGARINACIKKLRVLLPMPESISGSPLAMFPLTSLPPSADAPDQSADEFSP